MSQAPILEVKNLSVSVERLQILRDVSFSVDQGEVVAIIGPNGAGKTVLLKALLGVMPHAGTISWRGDAKIGYVPQRFTADKTLPLTVREFFLLHERRFLLSGGSAEERVKDALRTVEVSERLMLERIGTLSGGELQRVMIAWALFDKPNVLLFDEPTAGIDVGGEETVYNLLHALQDRLGITIMLVSHELNVVFRYATKVLCLNRALICSGAPREILTPEQLSKLYGEPTYYHHLHEYHDQ